MPCSVEVMAGKGCMGAEFHCQPRWRIGTTYASNQTRDPFDLIKSSTRQSKLQFNCGDRLAKD